MQSITSRLPILLSISLLLNIPLGYLRQNYERYSWQWFALIHASIPVILPLRKKIMGKGAPKWVVPVNIGAAVVGQLVGGRMKVHQGQSSKGEIS